MNSKQKIVEKRIKTHTVQSDEDRSAVTVLQTFLRSGGKINSNFEHGDKWPNIDGTFEFVPEPSISRHPKQNFSVQIKGTTNYNEADGVIKYSLGSLGFPAYIYDQVTLDPGILFVVLNPNIRGEERVFWKYMSKDFINSINYEQKSTTISFSSKDEIMNTETGIDEFCNKLVEITEHHSFINQLDDIYYSSQDIEKIIKACDLEICENIDRSEVYNDTRDNISRRMLTKLDDLCKSTLILNLINESTEKVNIRLAWERAALNIETKYLGKFYKALRYIGNRIPDEGQSERLMLKYYDFLWQIRRFLKDKHGLCILRNLEQFPLEIDCLDKEYYELVANVFDANLPNNLSLCTSRYYIQRKTPFFINGERYYEVTLQLADIYATKYNRITAYTKENLSTDYSIQIGYVDKIIKLWDIDSKIRIITNWQVSINPKSLNKLGKILKAPIKLTSKHNEYLSLMRVLTQTGINLAELINLEEQQYLEIVNRIYYKTNTNLFYNVIEILRKKFQKGLNTVGRYTIRYLIMALREDLFEKIMPREYNTETLRNGPLLSTRCYPFEKNPFISNLVGKKTSENKINAIIDIAGEEKFKISEPYIRIKKEINKTGEIYFEINEIINESQINNYNSHLGHWEQQQGYKINNDGHFVCIDSYEKSTAYILNELLKYSKKGINGQAAYNKNYLKNSSIDFTDPLKKQTLGDIFVNSQVLLLYGATGTGKTTLMNYISNLFANSKKLYLTKTHTALQNLKRKINPVGQNDIFMTIDGLINLNLWPDYDVIFIDECSTIDNRTIQRFFEKIKEDSLLVLAGDIHQIESIDFGNWFFYAKEIIKTKGANVELLNTWRTQDEDLKSLWNEVRHKKNLITEKLVIDGPYSENIGEQVLKSYERDEVILCLNYDGKFGLNNINHYFQNANENEAIFWQEWSYKKGDPILFNDNKRFSLLYNNLKGRIFDIKIEEDGIYFTIDVDIILTEILCKGTNINFIEVVDDNTTRIGIKVYKLVQDSEESSEISQRDSIIPFQLAYAVSIHKAQGLEYDSVKIIIPSNNSEKITHGIFYTAITRAKKNLKIFWSPESMQQIINGFNIDNSKLKSLEHLKSKLSQNING